MKQAHHAAGQGTLYFNGVIHRDAFDRAPADALLEAGGEILWIGAARDAPCAVHQVDLGGRHVLPGLTEAHAHLLLVAQARLQLSAAAPEINSQADYLQLLAQASDRNATGLWLFGSDIDEQRWPEKALPTRDQLDQICPVHPLLLRRFCGHVAIANSAALQALGIDEMIADPEGGIFDRAAGRLTGIARERAAEMLFQAAPRQSDAVLADATRKVMADLVSWGVTAAVEPAIGFGFGFDAEWGIWQLLRAQGDLPLRMGFLAQLTPQEARARGLRPEAARDWQLMSLKLFADGIVGARTAAMYENYHDRPSNGSLMGAPEALRETLQSGDLAGWQMAVHTIGDRAIDLVISALSETVDLAATRQRRHRIEHFGFPRADAPDRAARAGIVVVTQPAFLRGMGESWKVAMGPRASEGFPAASLLRAGIVVAGSSDAPTGPLSPWLGVESFIERRSNAGSIIGAGECLSRREALHAYIHGGAYVMGQEGWRGALRSGMAADFAAFDENPFSASALGQMKAALTVVAGRAVYDPSHLTEPERRAQVDEL